MMITLKEIAINNFSKKEVCETTGNIRYVFSIQTSIDMEASRPLLEEAGYLPEDLIHEDLVMHDLLPHFVLEMTSEQFKLARLTQFESLMFQHYSSGVCSDVTDCLIAPTLKEVDQRKVLLAIQTHESKVA